MSKEKSNDQELKQRKKNGTKAGKNIKKLEKDDKKLKNIVNNRNLPASLQRGRTNHKWIALLTVLGALILKLVQDYNQKKANKHSLYSSDDNIYLDYSLENSVLKDYHKTSLNNKIYPFKFIKDDPIVNSSRGSNFIKYEVESTFLKDWEDYFAHGFGYDIYEPIKQKGKNFADKNLRHKSEESKYIQQYGESFPLGYMIIDSLDTMLLMYNNTDSLNNNLKFKFHIDECLKFIENNIAFDKIDHDHTNVFETTIRVLGGLLASYNLVENEPFLRDSFPEGNIILKRQALELGSRLLKAFEYDDGSFNPIPLTNINLATGKKSPSGEAGGVSSVSEITTLQLEFKYLAEIAPEGIFPSTLYHDIEIPFDVVQEKLTESSEYDELIPQFISSYSKQLRGGLISMGSRADSYYEYLIKQYHYNSSDTKFQQLFWKKLDKIKQYMIKKTAPLNLPNNIKNKNKKNAAKWKRLTYIAELPNGVNKPDSYSSKFDHLNCFLPGSILLGVTKGQDIDYITKHKKEFDDIPDMRENYDLALDLVRTCYHMYLETEVTNLAPEIVVFNDPDAIELKNDVHNYWYKSNYDGFFIKPLDVHNLQRPETVESIYYAYKVSKSRTFQIWNFGIFKKFVQYGKGKCLKNVVTGEVNDQLESFWFSETLKYLYLTFLNDDEGFALTDVVFNTEAHAFPVLKK
ncbi:seven-hairpin glycosidase [Hanseniaspora valbyensis NRRL Y-1626]|uniref:alpha-1,2-Mannosidase n=1 Tax=Hanseniaspora valbyensis NRRL Y-1626 TaxID=766949 RepID=A0A1B7TJP1_9ASCO|nr:seven-hairpin glycosidase [Hanseniaspora valbyensis NRRL Y-1626]